MAIVQAKCSAAEDGSFEDAPANSLEQLPQLEDRVHVQSAVKIGSGNLGVVLLVHDRQNPERKLAVKVISMQFVRESGNEEDRVWREVQVMRDVDRHQHIVQLVDVLACWNRIPHVASDPPHLCIAMEYVNGSEPLSNTLRRRGASKEVASQVMPQVADALCMMHQKGLVHRDVWSENILVSHSTGRAVLVDLGCAEYVGSELAINSKLNIPYMSPEAAAGLRPSPADDCWALGLLLTEMLTGRFVADRLGRSDWPIHYCPNVLAEAISETCSKNGGCFGTICSKLLDCLAEKRLNMASLTVIWNTQASQASFEIARTPSPKWQPKCFFPQQRILGPLQRRKQASSALVPSSSTWNARLAADGQPSGSSTEQVYGPAHVQLVQVRPRPQNIVVNTVIVGRAQRNKVVSGVVASGEESAETVADSTTMPVAKCTSPQRFAIEACAGSSITTAVGPATLRSTTDLMKLPKLAAGLRVSYTARSNGQDYLGVVLGRFLGQGQNPVSGWRIVLDVGVSKEVADSETWRVKPMLVPTPTSAAE